MFGRNQHGGEAIGILTETFAGAGGARSFADGIDVGGEIPNPISRMANIETMENSFPVRYLFRRRLTDSGGPGRYRGGAGMEMGLVPHDAPDGGLNYVISGKGSDFPMSEGLAAGYPGAPNSYVWVHNNETPEDRRNTDAAFAQSLDDMTGEKESVTWGVYPLMGEDALYVAWNGGGGYGDPLERDPEAVLADCRDGVVSRGVAVDVYGVVADEANAAVDIAATGERRQALRNARLSGKAAE
jgi:N-methylhydantoinase B